MEGRNRMRYLLYLRRSVTRNPRRHLTLLAVLTCAFLLPLLISIYRDSRAYGTEQELLAHSAGETFHIANAAREDIAYFENIPGLSAPSFRDGTIYLHILSDAEWMDRETMTFYENKVLEQVALTGNDRLIPRAFSYESAHGISTDDVFLSGQRVLLAVDLVIILISVLIVQSAYKSHLNRFAADIGTLASCGANRRQIGAIFVIEFLAAFFLSALGAVGISVTVMKALLGAFLEIKEGSGLAWLIFYVNPASILLHLLLFFLTLGIVLGHTLWKNSRKSAWTMLRSEEDVQRVKRGGKPLRVGNTPVNSLCRLWRSRTNGSFRSCLAVSIPIMVIFLFLFNYLMLGLKVTGTAEEWALRISKEAVPFGGFTPEDIDYVSALDGVERVQPLYEIRPDKYMAIPLEEWAPGKSVRIRQYSSLAAAAGQTLSKYEIAVGRDPEFAAYSDGDTLRMCLSDDYDAALPEPLSKDAVTELKIAAVVDAESVDWALDIYLSDELYHEIISAEPVNILDIALKDPSLSRQAEDALRMRFSGAEYEIKNRQSSADFMRQAYSGIFLLLLYIFCVLFLFALTILCIKLCDYIENCRKTIRSLYVIGAPRRVLYRSYIRQAAVSTVIAAAAPFFLCLPLSAAVANSLKAPMVLDGMVLTVYGAVVLLLTGSYLYPVHRSLKRILGEL